MYTRYAIRYAAKKNVSQFLSLINMELYETNCIK